MVNNRLVLLSAVALVAIISPILKPIMAADGTADPLSAKDQEALKKLKENILPDEEINNLLSNFENQDFILFDDIKVRDVLAMLDLSVDGCLGRIVSENSSKFARVQDPILAINLYKFTRQPWIPFCAKNLEEAFASIFSREGPKPTCGAISNANDFLKTLESVSDEPLSKNYSLLIRGKHEELHNYCVSITYLSSVVPDIYNKMANIEEKLGPDDIEQVNILSSAIHDDPMIEKTLRSLKRWDFEFCRDTAVWTFFHRDNQPRQDPWWCANRISAVKSSRFADIENPTLAKNLYKFAFRNLIPYCADNLETVFKYFITESEHKHTCDSLIGVNNFLEGLEYFTGESFSKKASQLVQRVDKALYDRCSGWDFCIKRAPLLFSNQANTE